MHPADKVNQFIELRAKGLSIPTISQRLGVPASTLYDWNQRSHDPVQKLKRAIFEEIEETVLGPHHLQFDSLACVLKAIDRQIIAETSNAIKFQKLPNLIRMSGSLRRQLYDLRRLAFDHLDTPRAAARTQAQDEPITPAAPQDPKP